MLCRIGAGAYGEVWLARNTLTRAERAVKIVYRATFADDRPFQREFEGIKRFDAVSRSHPTQLALFHVGKGDGFFYYVMELADPLSGPAEYRPHTLRSDLENGRLAAAKVLDLGLTLAEALYHLHAAGLVHRDVKPSNIIFVRGKPKLADIGLVTDASDSQSIVGTEGYLPREGPGTPAADLFALGKVLYECLTGLDRCQFPELPRDLREWPDAKLAFELNTLVVRLCAANSDDRQASAATLLSDLEYLKRGKSLQRRQSLLRAGLMAVKVVVVVVLLGGAIAILRRERNRADSDRIPVADFANSGTTNLAAFEANLRGETLFQRFTPFGFSNAISYYQRALELDPNYSKVWTSLAGAICLSVEKGFVPGPEGLPKAMAAAEKALELNPKDARALHWKGFCILSLDYDFARAKPLFERAIELDSAVFLQNNYAGTLWQYGRFDEAEKIFRDVLRNSPQQGYCRLSLGFVLASRGKLYEALTEMNDSILLVPAGFPVAYLERGMLLWEMGRRNEALRDWEEYLRLGGYPMLPSDDPLLAAAGKISPEEFLSTLTAELEKCRAGGKFVSAYDIARFYAMLGDKGRAIDYLEASVDEHRQYALSAKVHIIFRDFQDEPRYHAVLRRFKLKQ